jgi:molybdenum cofactor synthesis domain-containing protein
LRKIFHRLVSPSDVIKIVGEHLDLKPLGTEVVDLGNALGRVLAEDVIAGWDVPPYDRSEVDGYAVSSLSVEGAEEDKPVVLEVAGSVRIGEVPKVEVKEGVAVEIDTGAVIPRGADSVVMVEYTKKDDGKVFVFRASAPGENIARVGSDILKGEILLRGGRLLGVGEIASLAAVGVRSVKVFRKPKVAVFSIGNEIIEPGESLELPKIFNVNMYSIAALLRELGAEPIPMGILPDDPDVIRNALLKALSQTDMIITSGGTSAGIGDLTYRVFDELGEPGVVVHGLKQKPGKPSVIAVVRNKLVVGLPGFPLSCIMAFRNAIAPLIARLAGLSEAHLKPWSIRAVAAQRINGLRGKEVLLPVVLVYREGKLLAYPVKVKSGSVYVLTYADGFVRLPEDRHVVEEGEEVQVELFTRSWRPAELIVIGSHDYVLEYLIMKALGLKENAKIVPAGSTQGILTTASGLGDVGGSHLYDPETGEYNLPFIERLGARDKVYVVRGWRREIGLVVRKGNPKGIRGLKDLLRDDVVFVNRNTGSGTRTYVDQQLRVIANEIGKEFNELKRVIGYFNEAKTHTGVAASVAQGRADVGVAVKHAAKLYGLDFIKLTEEVYDLIIYKKSISSPLIKELISLLRSPKFDEVLKNYEGYRRDVNTGMIIHSPSQ